MHLPGALSHTNDVSNDYIPTHGGPDGFMSQQKHTIPDAAKLTLPLARIHVQSETARQAAATRLRNESRSAQNSSMARPISQ